MEFKGVVLKRSVFEAVVVALGLVLLGRGVGAALVQTKEMERVVTVRGLSERNLPADQVIWPLLYKELGNDLTQLHRTLEKKNGALLSFLLQNGLDSGEVTLAAPSIKDLEADRYDNSQFPYRYKATSVVTVASNKVELVQQLMGRQAELLLQGIALSGEEWNSRTLFNFTGLNSIKPEMIEEATRAARQAAVKFADDSGSRLGKIRSATQGQFTIVNRDDNTPHIKTVRVVTTVDFYLED